MNQTVTLEWLSVTRSVDPQRLWYLQNGISDHNATVYADILADMEGLEGGMFTCTLRVTNGYITDYVLMNNNAQTSPAPISATVKQRSQQAPLRSDNRQCNSKRQTSSSS